MAKKSIKTATKKSSTVKVITTPKSQKSAQIGTFVKSFYAKHGKMMSKLAYE
jgi:hypothetical protein